MASPDSTMDHCLAPETFVTNLAHGIKRQEYLVFCGAGISANSGLPTAWQLVDGLLDALPYTPEDRQIMSPAKLPFEAFLQLLSESAAIEPLLRLYGRGRPTATHALLAKLVRKTWIKTLCTTNFDTLLEQALKAEGLRRGVDYRRIHQLAAFAELDDVSMAPQLIKLHGTVDRPATIAATIRSVASRQYRPEQAELLGELFAGDPDRGVIVLGYSGSDKFDIMPQIAAIRGVRRPLVIVNHAAGTSVANAIVAERRHLPPNHPWKFYTPSVEVTVDTDLLVQALWTELLDQPPVFARHATGWHRAVRVWCASLALSDPSSPLRVVARIFEEIGHTPKALDYLHRAVAISSGHPALPYFRLQGDLGRVSNSAGDYRGAVVYGWRALSGARHLGDPAKVASELGNLGLAYYNLGRPRTAIWLHRRAWRLAKLAGADQIRANQLGNIGLVYRSVGRHRRSAACHLGSIRLNQRRGSVRQEAAQFGNLGICLRYMGNLPAAAACHGRALELFEMMGDQRRAGIELGSLGIIKQRQDECGAAQRLFRQALAVARQAGDRRSIFNQLNSIAELATLTGHPRRSQVVGTHALKIATLIGHRYSIGEANLTVGRAYLALGDIRAARCHAQMAVEVLQTTVPANHPCRLQAVALLSETAELSPPGAPEGSSARVD